MYGTKTLTLCASVLLISACSGGGGSGSTAVTPETGVFIDGPVAGLHYETATRSGTTNSAGEYDYMPGETVTFSIGGISLGTTTAGPVVTPLSLVPSAVDASDPEVTNIVRLLLTLDDDGDPDNGITITPETATAAAGLTVDFTATDLTTDTGVSTLLAAIPGTPVLVAEAVAQIHFTTTLASITTWGSMTWGSGKWQAAAP